MTGDVLIVLIPLDHRNPLGLLRDSVPAGVHRRCREGHCPLGLLGNTLIILIMYHHTQCSLHEGTALHIKGDSYAMPRVPTVESLLSLIRYGIVVLIRAPQLEPVITTVYKR